MRSLLVSVWCAVLLSSSASGASAVDLGAEPEVLACFADVLRRGGLGERANESAAFIVRDKTGHYSCSIWPIHNGYEEHRYRGTPPAGVVAIAHTHPKHALKPSPADIQAAFEFGGPVFVLTPTDIYVATPDGRVLPVVTNRVWIVATANATSASRRSP